MKHKHLTFLLAMLMSMAACVASADTREYVDLGLPSGTLWATCNVGANNPEDYGDYFAWGETVPYGGTDESNAMNYSNAGTYTKTDYVWRTYKYCKGSYNTLTKYCSDSSHGYNGFTDNLTELVSEDDAATTNWGSGWRMPTIEQLDELTNSDYTTSESTTVNGVYGRKITSKVSGYVGNFIFLPAAGFRYMWPSSYGGSSPTDPSLYNAGSSGYFWSRTLFASDPDHARGLGFVSSIVDAHGRRSNGLSVRPVRVVPTAADIALSPSSLSLAAGGSTKLVATVSPDDAAATALTWSSSDTGVAVVGSDGVVVAVAPGTCTITCKTRGSSNVSATCEVTVFNDGSESIGYGKFYLQNISTGKYWGAGNDWGTRASLVIHPEFVELQKLSDGRYCLKSQVIDTYYGEQSYYFDGDYMDKPTPQPLYITATSDDSYTIGDGTVYYGYDGTSSVLGKTETNPNAASVQWKIISEEEMMERLSTATETNPIDATFLIQDADFGRNNMYYDSWNWTFPGEIHRRNTGEDVNFCVESWRVAFTFSQTLTGIPNGIYALSAQGFYGQEGEDYEHLPVFFANGKTRVFPMKKNSESSVDDASNSFRNGEYVIEPIVVEVTDGTLCVGTRLEENTKLWCAWDKFSLMYYGMPNDIVNLADGKSFSNDVGYEVNTLSYTRNFTNTDWQALYVPFEMQYEDWKDDFEVARINNVNQYDDDEDGNVDRTVLEMFKVKSGHTEAHTPYLIKAKTMGEKTISLTNATLYRAEEKSYDVSSWNTLYTFTGTYTGVSGATMFGEGYYALGSGSLHQAADATNALSPMRWYMAVTDRDGNPKNIGEVKVVVFGMDEDELIETGLEEVGRDAISTNEQPVFDLNGRRVTNPRKGLYIKNGKKFVVK